MTKEKMRELAEAIMNFNSPILMGEALELLLAWDASLSNTNPDYNTNNSRR